MSTGQKIPDPYYGLPPEGCAFRRPNNADLDTTGQGRIIGQIRPSTSYIGSVWLNYVPKNAKEEGIVTF